MNLGEILLEERKRQGISQQKLADMACVTKRSIVYWEKGSKCMSVESADKVFKALKVSITLGNDSSLN
ncbi:helix-turn-helix domain-containing protein [Aminipila terrae]|uniref:Helix-turn-helix domain-containing protein n=2 Tax=Aminipila terrae TaxID=2697030 RepID=A0A6P1MIY5_9FIRM|nr:helix-turn-helix domain-containing protein [Aminipila terrae]